MSSLKRTSSERVVKLESSARRKKVPIIYDLIPALMILFTALNSLMDGVANTITYINIVSGGLMVIFCRREWRSLKEPVHEKIRWYDIVSGIVVALNAGAMYKPWKGFQPAHLYFLTSLLLVLKGISAFKPQALFRRLIISEAGFTLKIGPFSTHHFAWDEVLEVEIADHILNVTTPEGTRTISLKKIADTGEMSAALSESLRIMRSMTGDGSSTSVS